MHFDFVKLCDIDHARIQMINKSDQRTQTRKIDLQKYNMDEVIFQSKNW